MIRVVSVAALDGFRLAVKFDDGTWGKWTSLRLFGPMFEPLASDPELFHRVSVDEFGAVSWPNGADLAPDALYRQIRGTPVGTR